ncbi:hypothetical protein [Burkholderia glumae]|uniref:hypothetical protein n=1 Tax=Burkholderia glumae TaxID=337 RepID=UPI002151E5AA|nr:hypothetical protein [Burkholderia glumae]
MKPLFDAYTEDRRAAIHFMQFGDTPSHKPGQSHFQQPKSIESTTIWRSTLVAALIVIAINVFQDGPTAPVQAVSHTTV